MWVTLIVLLIMFGRVSEPRKSSREFDDCSYHCHWNETDTTNIACNDHKIASF